MKKILFTIICGLLYFNSFAQKPDTLWFQHNDRFTVHEYYALENVDSIAFNKTQFRRFKYLPSVDRVSRLNSSYFTDGVYRLDDIEPYLVKPSGYASCDFTKEDSQWCFQRSMESEHFIVFWEKGLTLSKSNTISLGGSTININTFLSRAETIRKKNVEELGFIELPDVKIEMFIVNQTDWRADGSGQDGTVWYYDGTTKKSRSAQVGLFHCNPWAASSESGHTQAHELGHVFQYLISGKYGTTRGWRWGYNNQGGCAWWESCAQWQAFQVYPVTLFTNGYYSQMLSNCHKHLLHEDWRYANYFIQYYWCQLYGQDFIGKLWLATKSYEDPVQTYIRMNNITMDDFNKMMFDYACRAVTWDIDGLRDRGKNYQDQFTTSLVLKDGTANTLVVSSDNCPQNFGMNIIPLKGFESGTTVKCNFKGIAGADGYRKINVDKAGWRYGFVAQTSNGDRVYGDMYSEKEGVAEMTLPENTNKVWFVVTGAPTEHFFHVWDDSDTNDEQWPYEVVFENCNARSYSRTYHTYTDADFPEDYVRKDTTVVLDATLAYSSSSYSSVRVQYDTDAISEALGVSSEALKSLKRNTQPGTAGTLVFAGVNSNGTTYTYNTTTSTSSSTCYGHWFTTAGNVCSYDSSAAIFAELYPDKYGCYVGQYPGHLTKGKTYTIRQAVVYTHTDGKQYKAIMEVHLSVN